MQRERINGSCRRQSLVLSCSWYYLMKNRLITLYISRHFRRDRPTYTPNSLVSISRVHECLQIQSTKSIKNEADQEQFTAAYDQRLAGYIGGVAIKPG
jgi:hypothetical protein